MRRVSAVLSASAVALWAVVVLTAQEAPPAEYVQAMQSIRAAAMAAGAETVDYAALSTAATEAASAFMYVQTFWQERGDAAAAELAGTGARAAQGLVVAADMSSGEGVAFSAMEMGATCGGCHMAHRVRLEDGSFQIQ
jgi:hypothetical protein